MIKDCGKYSNADIAEILTNIATAYEIKNKTHFRIVAYQNAADTISTYPQSIQELWQSDPKSLDNIPGVGEAILTKLNYLFVHNQLHPSIVKAFKNIHPAVFTFTKINAVGPKIAHKLTTNLEFSSDPETALEELINYANTGQIRHLETFGEKSEKLILDNTLNFLGRQDKMPLTKAQEIAKDLLAYLQPNFPDVEFIPLGSLRREAPYVGDIDIAAIGPNSQDIIDHFINYPQGIHTIIKGPKKASILIKNDIRLDLMVQPLSTVGSLLVHFTGSKQHNIILRKYAQGLGYSISEYGIKDLRSGQIHTFATEKDFYHFLGLNWVPPQERLGENELETYKTSK
jgi:DNA polymerase (family 10)